MNYEKLFGYYKHKYLNQVGGRNITKLVAIDFDNTISRDTAPKIVNELMDSERSDTQDAIDTYVSYPLEETMSDLFLDSDFLNKLRSLKEKGYIFVVTSFGMKDVIIPLLKKAKAYDIFSQIYTPQDFGYEDGFYAGQELDGKNKMIKRALQDNNLTNDNSLVLLVDDSKENINKAMFKGYRVYKVSPKAGLAMDDKVPLLKELGDMNKKADPTFSLH